MADNLRQVVLKDLKVWQSDEGETFYTAGGSGTTRFIADKHVAPFALIHTRGGPDHPVLPHFHRAAIDTWLVLKGKINNWAGDEGRVLCSGDFAFVPPGVVHSFQVIEPHTEFIGVIHPAEWIEFFRAIMEPWHGPGIYPDKGPGQFSPAKIMKAIQDGHDVIPQPHVKFPAALHEWKDSEIPDSASKPYWIKAHRNKRFALGGQTLSPLANATVTRGLFSMAWLEGSRNMPHPARLASYAFEKQCFVFYVTDGSWSLRINSEEAFTLHTGESAYVPPGKTFALHAQTIFARLVVTADGAGLEPIFKTAGKEIEGVLGETFDADSSEKDADISIHGLAEASKEFSFAIM